MDLRINCGTSSQSRSPEEAGKPTTEPQQICKIFWLLVWADQPAKCQSGMC